MKFAKLQDELEAQQSQFNLLEKNADRISAIQSGVRQLDSQIAVSKTDPKHRQRAPYDRRIGPDQRSRASLSPGKG